MIYFNDIKLESKTEFGSFSKNLVLMIVRNYRISFDDAYNMVQITAKESKSHVEFLNKLRKKLNN